MKNIVLSLTTTLYCLLFSSCLGIQSSYDYEPANIDNNVHMNTWEFIQSRPDAFSSLKRAIEHSGIDINIYTQTDRKYTYLLLHNDAFKGANGILSNYGAASIEDMDKETLKNILLYHTVDGNYHGLGTLNFDPTYVITLWKSPDAFMTLRLNNKNSIEQYSRLIINDMAGNSTPVTAITSNILTTNGVVHVVDTQIVYKP